ncbi:OsmC family protein [Streptomyces sp. NPDC048179]|uniref:OsmC family protein n=1 Tax=Streptomyces sp. NPDC048179 TaxID=3365506 RepID=UPI00371A8741
MLGTQSGGAPVELSVVPLATCVAHYARGFLECHRLAVERLGVATEFTMADDRPARVASVRLRVTVPPGLDEAGLTAFGAMIDHCGLHGAALLRVRLLPQRPHSPPGSPAVPGVSQ